MTQATKGFRIIDKYCRWQRMARSVGIVSVCDHLRQIDWQRRMGVCLWPKPLTSHMWQPTLKDCQLRIWKILRLKNPSFSKFRTSLTVRGHGYCLAPQCHGNMHSLRSDIKKYEIQQSKSPQLKLRWLTHLRLLVDISWNCGASQSSTPSSARVGRYGRWKTPTIIRP